MPPRSSTSLRGGFLSGRSLEYIGKVRDGELEWDTDAIGYAHLKRDVGHAIADFRALVTLEESNLFELLVEWVTEGDMSRDFEEMGYEDKRRQIAWIGLFTFPRLYDRSFGFGWEDEMWERVKEVIEDVGDA